MRGMGHLALTAEELNADGIQYFRTGRRFLFDASGAFTLISQSRSGGSRCLQTDFSAGLVTGRDEFVVRAESAR